MKKKHLRFVSIQNGTQALVLIEPRHEKTCLQGSRSGKTQTGLLSYRDKLESLNIETEGIILSK